MKPRCYVIASEGICVCVSSSFISQLSLVYTTRFILNLENRPFSREVRENLEQSGNFLLFVSKSGKTNYLVSISFSLTIAMVVVLIVISKYKLYALFCEVISVVCIMYLPFYFIRNLAQGLVLIVS